jgi:hypothetical protein
MAVVIDSPKVEMRQTASLEDIEVVIRAVYKQVLGNCQYYRD